MHVDPLLVEFLKDPESYPERPLSVVHHETHISHVFVGDRCVYKIKKSVNFGFLDFTTLERRRFFCKEEVRLNKRLAPDVYLGAVPVFRTPAGYSLKRQKGAAIVEYAVKMRRIPEERLLYSLIHKGSLLRGDLGEVGEMIARFHTAAPAHRNDPFGGVEAVRMNTEENFEQIRPFIGRALDDRTFASLVSYTREFMRAHDHLFAARKQEGFVREGHGDLYSRHVCLVVPPIIVDCIEFNKRFRIGDVLEDLGFLLMDLEYQGRFDLSTTVTRAYFPLIPGAEEPGLLRFYKIYRAVVRGKIEAFSAESLTEEAARQAAGLKARHYFLLARHYIEDVVKLFNPVVFMGVSGSGKSAIARGLFDRAVVIASDSVRKEMAGIQASEHVYVPYGEAIYKEEATNSVYGEMTRQTLAAAARGERVIVDATFLAASRRLQLYEASMSAGLNPFFVHCFADEETLKGRIARRIVEGKDLSDAQVAVLERQLAIAEEPDELPSFRVMRLDTSRESPEAIRETLREFL